MSKKREAIITAPYLDVLTNKMIISAAKVLSDGSGVEQLMEASTRISNGDLTEYIDVKTSDEIGLLCDRFNRMTHSLQSIVSEVQQNAYHLASSSEQLLASAEQSGKASEHIATTMQEVAAGVENRIQSMEQTSSVINKMSQSLSQVALKTQLVSDSASLTLEKAAAGTQSIHTAGHK